MNRILSLVLGQTILQVLAALSQGIRACQHTMSIRVQPDYIGFIRPELQPATPV